MCVVLSTTAYFFLCVSPRSEYGYFSRDEKGGSGWPVDRRGHARIGSQGYQSTEDKHHQQRRWRQRLRDDQEVQARHIQSEMGRLWKHKFQRRHHVHVCRGDRLLRHFGLRERTDTRSRNHARKWNLSHRRCSNNITSDISHLTEPFDLILRDIFDVAPAAQQCYRRRLDGEETALRCYRRLSLALRHDLRCPGRLGRRCGRCYFGPW